MARTKKNKLPAVSPATLPVLLAPESYEPIELQFAEDVTQFVAVTHNAKLRTLYEHSKSPINDLAAYCKSLDSRLVRAYEEMVSAQLKSGNIPEAERLCDKLWRMSREAQGLAEAPKGKSGGQGVLEELVL